MKKSKTTTSAHFINLMSLTTSSPDRRISFVIVLGSLIIAILFGWIATTANLVAISIVIALFAGGGLLIRPEWIVWIILSLGMLFVGVAPLYDERLDQKVGWAISLLGFFLMLVAFFKVATTPASRKNTPLFIWLLLGFFIYAILNSLLHWYSAEEFVGGFKRYFQMWGIIFALCWMTFSERYIQRLRMFFLMVALIQLPFVIYQFIVLVPFREGMQAALPEMVPIDVVSGTFGATIYAGGSSGEMATFLVIVFAFLLAGRMYKALPAGRFILFTIVALAPLFLGETRAVIIMLPLTILTLYRREFIVRPLYGLVALFMGALLTAGLGYVYLHILQMSLQEALENTIGYNLQEEGYGTNYLNRVTALSFWTERQGAHDPVSFLFGNGLGSSHQGTSGHMDIRYPRYGIGMTSASTLLWDVGVFGCGLFASVLYSVWRCASQLHQESTEPTVRADAAAIQVTLMLFIFHIFYRLEFLENISFQIVFASVLGYLAWLYRRHVASIAVSRL